MIYAFLLGNSSSLSINVSFESNEGNTEFIKRTTLNYAYNTRNALVKKTFVIFRVKVQVSII